MRRFAIIALSLALAAAACDRASDSGSNGAGDLSAPTQDAADAASAFTPVNEAATNIAGDLQVRQTTRMPDAAEAAKGEPPQDMINLRGAAGLVIDAELTGANSPAVLIGGQTTRALLELPVEAAQTLIYRVTRETKGEGGHGICGESDVAYIVTWQSTDPAESDLKVLGVSGAAPGEANARACAMMAFHRS